MLCPLIQDPEAEAEPADELLTRQFTAISDGLGDAAPAVRAAAVGGLCGLLNMFWELLPAPVIAGYLKRITGPFPLPLMQDEGLH